MAGYLESQAALESQVTAVGLADVWPTFKALGWTTYANFAFSVHYVPGASDDSKFTAEVVEKLLPTGDVRAPAVRRLFYEAYSLFVGDLQQKMERTEDAAPRKLVVPEREARRSLSLIHI